MPETRLYRKSATHFVVSNTVSLLYCVAKISFGAYLLYPRAGCEYEQFGAYYSENPLHQWIFWQCLHSALMILAYFSHLKFISNDDNRNILAQKLNHIIDHDENFEAEFFEDSKRISILTRQIKYEVQKSTCLGKWTTRLFGLGYQLLFFWGVVMFWSQGTPNAVCEAWQFYFMCAVLILCLYQYIDLYIIAIFAVIFSPCLLLFAVYYCAQHCAKEQHRQEVRDRLQPKKYQPNCVEGDPECPICRCAYELDESILTLSCSKFHHFHESCILSWMVMNATCPLCRQPI